MERLGWRPDRWNWSVSMASRGNRFLSLQASRWNSPLWEGRRPARRTDAGEWVLMQQHFVAKSRNLLELIQQNRPRVIAGFSGPQHRGSVDLRLCVAADAKGHIWVSAAGVDGVQVLVGDRWQSPPRSLRDPNSESPMKAVVIASLGERVYLNGQTSSSVGAPAFCACGSWHNCS